MDDSKVNKVILKVEILEYHQNNGLLQLLSAYFKTTLIINNTKQ